MNKWCTLTLKHRFIFWYQYIQSKKKKKKKKKF